MSCLAVSWAQPTNAFSLWIVTDLFLSQLVTAQIPAFVGFVLEIQPSVKTGGTKNEINVLLNTDCLLLGHLSKVKGKPFFMWMCWKQGFTCSESQNWAMGQWKAGVVTWSWFFPLHWGLLLTRRGYARTLPIRKDQPIKFSCHDIHVRCWTTCSPHAPHRGRRMPDGDRVWLSAKY